MDEDAPQDEGMDKDSPQDRMDKDAPQDDISAKSYMDNRNGWKNTLSI
jgi:hypothetical protein